MDSVGLATAGRTVIASLTPHPHQHITMLYFYISLFSDNLVGQLTTWKVTYIATNGKALFQVLVTERIPQ